MRALQGLALLKPILWKLGLEISPGAFAVMGKTANTIVALPAITDLDSLDSVRDRLIDAIAVGPAVVSGDAVERISTNALFLLLSAAETAKANHSAFEIEKPSAAMLAAIDRLGLGPRFTRMMTQ